MKLSPDETLCDEIHGDEEVTILNIYGDDPRICGYNEGGYNSVSFSIREIIEWARRHRPDLLKEPT